MKLSKLLNEWYELKQPFEKHYDVCYAPEALEQIEAKRREKLIVLENEIDSIVDRITDIEYAHNYWRKYEK